MFSSSSAKITPEQNITEQNITDIDVEMGGIPPFKYRQRQALREEKKMLQKELKEKQSVSLLDPHT